LNQKKEDIWSIFKADEANKEVIESFLDAISAPVSVDQEEKEREKEEEGGFFELLESDLESIKTSELETTLYILGVVPQEEDNTFEDDASFLDDLNSELETLKKTNESSG